MIVSRDDAKRVLAGRKTEIRIAQSRIAPPRGANVPLTARGGRGGRSFARVTVLDVEASTLQDATEADARAEGFRALADLVRAWGYDDMPARLVPVWVVKFEVDRTKPPRFLAGQVVAGREGGYVESVARALPDEPEPVDDDHLEQFVAYAREIEAERDRAARAARDQLDYADRLKAYEAEALARHIDIRDELRVLRRYGHKADVREVQVEAIRRKIDPVAA